MKGADLRGCQVTGRVIKQDELEGVVPNAERLHGDHGLGTATAILRYDHVAAPHDRVLSFA